MKGMKETGILQNKFVFGIGLLLWNIENNEVCEKV